MTFKLHAADRYGQQNEINKLHKIMDTPISNIYTPQRFIRCNFHLHFDSDRKVANQQSFANEIIYFVLFCFGFCVAILSFLSHASLIKSQVGDFDTKYVIIVLLRNKYYLFSLSYL